MNNIDHYIYKFATPIIVVVSVFYYLSLEFVLKHGYSASSVLLYRGIITFLLTVLLSLRSGAKVIPINISQQLLRVLVSGMALLLSFQSLKHLEAVTVSMVSRLDIPFAVLIAIFAGTQKWNYKANLSIFVVCLVLSIFFYAKHMGESAVSLAICILSVMMVSSSYLLAKKATKMENNFIIVNTTNVGCILVGLGSGIMFNNLNVFHLQDLWIFIIASSCQFMLNYTTSVLYRHHSAADSQKPYLIGVVVLLVLEQLWHRHIFDIHHDGIVLLVTGVIYLITLKRIPFWKRGMSES